MVYGGGGPRSDPQSEQPAEMLEPKAARVVEIKMPTLLPDGAGPSSFRKECEASGGR